MPAHISWYLVLVFGNYADFTTYCTVVIPNDDTKLIDIRYDYTTKISGFRKNVLPRYLIEFTLRWIGDFG